MSDTRYWAEWVSLERHNEFGEYDPDGAEYSRIPCRSLEDAKRIAVERGKSAGVAEWARVTQEDFLPELGIPKKSDAAWDTVAVWHGDWSGNWNEERWA